MELTLQIMCGAFGALFVWNGLQWIFAPEKIAQTLGMPMLSGVGASTQLGDLTALFLVNGLLVFLGLVPGYHQLLLAPASLVSGVALFRTLAYVRGRAPFTTLFIVVELLMAATLFTGYYFLA